MISCYIRIYAVLQIVTLKLKCILPSKISPPPPELVISDFKYTSDSFVKAKLNVYYTLKEERAKRLQISDVWFINDLFNFNDSNSIKESQIALKWIDSPMYHDSTETWVVFKDDKRFVVVNANSRILTWVRGVSWAF